MIATGLKSMAQSSIKIFICSSHLFLKKQYENYVLWLVDLVGAHQAALYLNKHTHFFIKSRNVMESNIPDADQLLLTLRTSGLRKFELVTQWLDQMHGVKISTINKNECSEYRSSQ